MKDGKAFSQLIEEYGAEEAEEKQVEELVADGKEKEPQASVGSSASSTKASTDALDKQNDSKDNSPPVASPLMSEEERNRGAVPMSVYANYLRHAGGVIWAPVILAILTLTQGASGTSLSSGFLYSRL